MYTHYVRERILRLHKLRYKPKNIVKVLENENIHVCNSAVRYIIAKYRRTGSIFDLQRSGRPPVIHGEGLDLINKWLCSDSELTTDALRSKLEEAGFKASRSTVAFRGGTNCVLFDCTMDSQVYTNILDTALVPFI